MTKGRPRNYVIKIYCRKCGFLLYKYLKEGEGHLVKCYASNILEDYTKESLKCPGCGEKFARKAVYHNRLANKIIQGKVYVRS